jgi:hypothetical protein
LLKEVEDLPNNFVTFSEESRRSFKEK